MLNAHQHRNKPTLKSSVFLLVKRWPRKVYEIIFPKYTLLLHSPLEELGKTHFRHISISNISLPNISLLDISVSQLSDSNTSSESKNLVSQMSRSYERKYKLSDQ